MKPVSFGYEFARSNEEEAKLTGYQLHPLNPARNFQGGNLPPFCFKCIGRVLPSYEVEVTKSG